ncbi:MAG: penicillin acylase family protein, partial [Thermoleophilaceae bacterium]
MSRGLKRLGLWVALAAGLFAAAPASAAVQPYGTNDYGGFRNILPPGQGQTANVPEILDFISNGNRPAHWDDQRELYGDLVYASPNLSDAQIDNYFKDGTFGVLPADATPGSHNSPAGHPGVQIVRDDDFGVPHVYGDTRDDVMFGAGYVGAEDRLFFMDVLRHSGRGQLSGFIGGSNKGMDAEQWAVAPYTEADLQRQFDLADDLYGATGARLQQDVLSYVAGVNQYRSEALVDPSKLPGEYTLLGADLDPWKVTDVIATAALVGGIFGRGGGGEVSNAEIYSAARKRFGKTAGVNVWKDLRRANDPEAPTTVLGRKFPYQLRKGVNPKATAIADPGSVRDGSPDDATTQGYLAGDRSSEIEPPHEITTPGGYPAMSGGMLDGLLEQGGASNALLVSGRESESGHPLAVFGPQVGYYSPEILMEEELHGPGIDAAGTAFVGVNLFVLLGRGQDYAWSATSAGQDIIDTFAERLCEPKGKKPSVNSMNYLWKGKCRPMEVLERVNTITPNPIDDSPAETFRMEAHRTVHGIVSQRGKVNGKPVAFAQQRSTYQHESDSALGFSLFNTPGAISNARDFQQAASKIGFSFNWFYADDRDIGYFNSGNNPVRAPGADPDFPNWGTGRWDWQNWNPSRNTARYGSFDSHPQVINQSYITSWNNKQAPKFSAAEDNYSYGSNHRSQSLDERVVSGISGAGKMTLAELIDAMEDAGTVDLRGSQVLPWMLKRLSAGGVPADLADEVALLQGWVDSGAHRRDKDQSGTYDDAAAVQLMDAWWPRVLETVFRKDLGNKLYELLQAKIGIDDPPAGGGSAYISGWYAYLEKDLRRIGGEKVKGALSRSYCGNGSKGKRTSSCKDELADSLRAAIGVPRSTLYPRGDNCDTGDDQMCNDAVRFAVTGGIGVEEIHWINRPTWQQ